MGPDAAFIRLLIKRVSPAIAVICVLLSMWVNLIELTVFGTISLVIGGLFACLSLALWLIKFHVPLYNIQLSWERKILEEKHIAGRPGWEWEQVKIWEAKGADQDPQWPKSTHFPPEKHRISLLEPENYIDGITPAGEARRFFMPYYIWTKAFNQNRVTVVIDLLGLVQDIKPL